MPSSRRASLPRRSLAAAWFVLLIWPVRVGFAESPSASESSPQAPATPPADYELDPTRAFGDRVILLVRTPGDDGVMTRLRADLLGSAWRIVEIRLDERFEPGPLGISAERERASAAVRIDTRRGTIELWVQRPEGPVEETIATPTDQRSEQVLALRVAEALRARGILLSGPTRRGREQAPRPIAAPTAAAPGKNESKSSASAHDRSDRAWLWFELGAGLALSPGGLEPLPLAEAGARLEFAERWSFSLNALVPVSHQTVTAAEGEAEVSTWLAGGALDFEWSRLPFGGLRSGIGAALAVTRMSGKASPDFASSEDVVTTFVPLARSSFYVDLGRRFRLRSGLAVGTTLPEVRVAFGSRDVASWGKPFLVMSLVLEMTPLP
jgi:hypothetical protein